MTQVETSERRTAPDSRDARPPTARRAVRLGLAVAALATLLLGVVTLTYTPAAATLVGLTPADGQVLAAVPTEVTLTFSGGAAPHGIHVSVADARGTLLVTGAPALVGRTATVPVTIPGGGTYLIGYHIVLADGNEASGITRFTVSGAAAHPGTGAKGTDATGSGAADATGSGAADAALREEIDAHAHAGHGEVWREVFGWHMLLIAALLLLTFVGTGERRPGRWRARV